MAFTGTAVVKMVADGVVRVTGLSLAAGVGGTIGLSTSNLSPGVLLPAQFAPAPYDGPDGLSVPLQDSVEVDVIPAAVGVATAIPFAVVKSGTTPLDFLVTISNTHGSLATPALEFYLKFHT